MLTLRQTSEACPDERLEIDLSFLYPLRRTSHRLRISGQCPLLQHCEMEARAALSMLDRLMQQFREALEASGAQGTDDWTYCAYAHENLPHVPAQVTHQDSGNSRRARTYFTFITPISADAEPTEFDQRPPFAIFPGPIKRPRLSPRRAQGYSRWWWIQQSYLVRIISQHGQSISQQSFRC